MIIGGIFIILGLGLLYMAVKVSSMDSSGEPNNNAGREEGE